MKKPALSRARFAQGRKYRPQLEALEARELLAASPVWPGYGGNAQHTALAPAGLTYEPLASVRFATPVDYNPVYSGNDLLIHYGSPMVTVGGEILVPVKVGATGGFQVEAHSPFTGNTDWVAQTDYILPPEPNGTWTPDFEPTLTVLPGSGIQRLYIPGPGGTVYYIDNPEANNSGNITGQFSFVGMTAYLGLQATLNADVYINTPITADNQGNIYFGYYVAAANPLGIKSGIARITPTGVGTWISAGAAAGDQTIAAVVTNCAPALSNNFSTLYIAVDHGLGGGFGGYLVSLNSTTLAPLNKVNLTDPATGAPALLSDDGTATPLVGPDGDVYYGVLENPFPGHNDRGWLLHFSFNLTTIKTPGSFGWDDTPSIVPASYVPSYTGTSTYLLFCKFNNYVNVGSGDGQNKIALLDPSSVQNDPIKNTVKVMKVVDTALSPTVSPAPNFPNARTEWCINSAVVVAGNGTTTDASIFVNNEDGVLYRWDLGFGSIKPILQRPGFRLTGGLGEAYTPTIIGADGTIFAISNATLFAIGLPTVTIDNPTVNELKNGTAVAIFTVSLSGSTASTVTVAYATADGTVPNAPGSFLPARGTADNLAYADYVSKSGLLTFLPGQLTETISIPIPSDSIALGDKFFNVVIGATTNVFVGNPVATCEILDDHLIPGVSVSNTSVFEGAGGTSTFAVFNLTLSDASALPVTVAYTTADGTATAAEGDYVPISGTVTFDPGTTQQQVFVQVNGSQANEADEFFTLNLLNPVNGLIVGPQAAGFILNDQNTLSVNNIAVVDGAGPTALATFTVTLTPGVPLPNGYPVTVNYSTADSTALAGTDYVATQGTLTFAPGVTSQQVTVTVLANGLYKPKENFDLVLSNPTNALISQGTGVATTTAGVLAPTVSINNISQENGNTGTTTNFNFTVTLSAAANVPVIVPYTTADGNAVAGTDYVGIPDAHYLVFPAGSTTQTLTVVVDGHTGVLMNQLTFTANLGTPINATIGVGTGTGTILNEYPIPRVTINNVTAQEKAGNQVFNFTVTLSKKYAAAVTVQYATANGTGVAGVNYVATAGVLTFPANTTVGTISVTVNGQINPQADLTFFVNLSNPVNAVPGLSMQGVGTMRNTFSRLSIANPAAVVDGTSGLTNMVFTVTLVKPPPGVAVTVAYSTANGPAVGGAVAGVNYAPVSGTLTFPAGATSETITVPLIGNPYNDITRTFTVTLGAATNALVQGGSGTATGTILDNVAPPVVSITSNVLYVDGTAGFELFFFSLTMSAPSSLAVTVDCTTVNGTAIAGIDYVGGTTQVTFAPGQTATVLTVVVLGTVTPSVSPADSFGIAIAIDALSAGPATIGNGLGTGTIVNNGFTYTPPS
jgi:hypothetical protein